MVDVDISTEQRCPARTARKRASLRTAIKRKSTAAFLMTLPLILLICILVIYPAFYSLHLATLNKSMQRFVGLGNFQFLFKRETFWLVVEQSWIFAITAVVFKALIGFIVAHFVHNIPAKGQRKWRGMLLVPWVIPPAMSTLAWLWLFDPSYSAFNYTLSFFGIGPIAWTGDPSWARFSVILVNIWYRRAVFHSNTQLSQAPGSPAVSSGSASISQDPSLPRSGQRMDRYSCVSMRTVPPVPDEGYVASRVPRGITVGPGQGVDAVGRADAVVGEQQRVGDEDGSFGDVVEVQCARPIPT